MEPDRTAVELAVRFLRLLEAGELDAAEELVGEDLTIIYPGREVYDDLRHCVADRTGRYRVRKTIEGTHVIGDGDDRHVYVFGALHGQHADGQSIDNVRFLDRLTFRDDRLVRHEIWNDLASTR